MMENRTASNPVDRPLVTLDNNALIALRNDEPAAPAVHQLLALNRAAAITINVTLSTALEARRSGERLEMHEFAAQLRELGIAPSNIFTHARTIGFRTREAPDAITFAVELEIALNRRIHAILFPMIPFLWSDYRDRECDRRRVSKEAMAELDRLRWVYIPPTPQAPARPPSPVLDALNPAERENLRALYDELHRLWSNAKNDALGLHNHITQAWHTTHPEHAVFVTSDKNFRKQTKRQALYELGFRGEILPPAEAVLHLLALTGVIAPAADRAPMGSN